MYELRYGTVNAFQKIDHGTENKKRCGTVRYGTVRFGTVRYGTVRFGTVRYGTVRYGTVRYGHGAKFGPPTVSNSIPNSGNDNQTVNLLL